MAGSSGVYRVSGQLMPLQGILPDFPHPPVDRVYAPASSGLIDDYKSLHGSASAPGTSAALGTSTTCQWQPPTYNSSRTFSARYPRPSRRGFSLNHGPAWRKKYSLVNRPLGSSDPPGDGAAQPPLRAEGSQGPEPQQYILERQVQLAERVEVRRGTRRPNSSPLAELVSLPPPT